MKTIFRSITYLFLIFFITISIAVHSGCGESEREKTARIDREKKEETKKRIEESAALDPKGYKNTKWGMTLAEVENVLKEKLINYPKGIYTNFSKINNEPCAIVYVFDDSERLASVIISYKALDVKYSSDINDFSEVEKLMIQKYGKVHIEQKTGQIDGTGAMIGDYRSIWKFPETIISLKYGNEKLGFSTGYGVYIYYVSTSYKEHVKDKPITNDF